MASIKLINKFVSYKRLIEYNELEIPIKSEATLIKELKLFLIKNKNQYETDNVLNKVSKKIQWNFKCYFKNCTFVVV